MKIEKLTQKKIKEIKKEIVENGILERGYSNAIYNAVDTQELLTVAIELAQEGTRLENTTQCKSYILTKYIENLNFQEFKKLLPFIF